METVLAQLRRAMEADVARDVLKMKESTTTTSSSSNAAPAPAAADDAATAALAAASAAGADDAAVDESQQVEGPAAADADAVVVEAVVQAEETPADMAPAAAGLEGSSSGVSTQLSSSAVGEAGTYSRMLPKGWGPRLGVGFSSYPRTSHNNIVSSANLVVKSNTAGDALSGAAGEAV
jgi:hypothetical protein